MVGGWAWRILGRVGLIVGRLIFDPFTYLQLFFRSLFYVDMEDQPNSIMLVTWNYSFMATTEGKKTRCQ